VDAAFVGYKVAGFLGALVATVAIFLPSFGFIGLASPFLLRLRQNPRVKCFLQGVLPAVLGVTLAATLPLAQAALIQDTWPLTLVAIALSLGALIALVWWKRPTWQLVPLGALVGLAVGAVA
jgi:chromate transporter